MHSPIPIIGGPHHRPTVTLLLIQTRNHLQALVLIRAHPPPAQVHIRQIRPGGEGERFHLEGEVAANHVVGRRGGQGRVQLTLADGSHKIFPRLSHPRAYASGLHISAAPVTLVKVHAPMAHACK